MALITLETTFTKNTSLQVGDLIYYLGTDSTVKKLGPVKTSSYIFFGKDNSKNTSGLLGYYMEVNIKNTSDDHAELFAVNSEIFISSN